MANRPNPSPYTSGRDSNMGVGGYAFDDETLDQRQQHADFGANALSAIQRPTGEGNDLAPQPAVSSPTYPKGERIDDDSAFAGSAEGGDQLPTRGNDRGATTPPPRFTYPNPGPGGRLGATG